MLVPERPFMSAEWIDVTVALENGMVHWEGDPEVKIYRHFELGVDGMPCNLTKLEISAHTATHMDAMCHVVKAGQASMKCRWRPRLAPAV